MRRLYVGGHNVKKYKKLSNDVLFKLSYVTKNGDKIQYFVKYLLNWAKTHYLLIFLLKILLRNIFYMK